MCDQSFCKQHLPIQAGGVGSFLRENAPFLILHRGMTADEATIDVIKNQLPKVANLVADGILNVENVDVFCEKGVFNVDQTRQILKEARKFGFKINFHGEELCQLNSVEVSKTNLGS